VCASVYDFIHDYHKFVYEIIKRMGYLVGVVSDVGGNFCVETADGLATVGHDLPRTVCLSFSNCAVQITACSRVLDEKILHDQLFSL
jgi:hypothetical protein